MTNLDWSCYQDALFWNQKLVLFYIFYMTTCISGKIPVQTRSRKTMEALLDAAERLLEGRPFAGISVQAIAEAADRSVGAFYGRFDGKPDLLRALYARQVRTHTATLAHFGPETWSGVPLREIMAAYCAFLVEDYRKRAGLRRAFVSERERDPELMAMAADLTARTRSALEDLLTERRQEHQHPDPSIAATFLHRLLFGLLRVTC